MKTIRAQDLPKPLEVRDENFVVLCETAEDQRAFLGRCEELGWKWSMGHLPTQKPKDEINPPPMCFIMSCQGLKHGGESLARKSEVDGILLTLLGRFFSALTRDSRRCPECGADGTVLLTGFDCSNPGCRNGRKGGHV